MSETRTLKDKLKNAQEVTSLASSDRLMVVGSDGSPKRIGRENLMFQELTVAPDSVGWIRIGQFLQTASVLLSILSQWSQTAGVRILVDFILHQNNTGYNKATVLSRMSNSSYIGVLTKCRIAVKSGNPGYLDIYYSQDQRNGVAIHVLDAINFSPMTPVMNPEIPEGYTVKEFDLCSVAWGG